MKNWFVVGVVSAIICACAGSALGQSDLSYWDRQAYGENISYPWYTYFGKKIVVDARYGFDQKKTAGLYVGKQIGNRTFSAIPAGGVLFGAYNGISPQIYLIANTGRFSLFTQSQYVKGLGSSNDYQYHWVDTLVSANKHIAAGVDWQVYHEWAAHYAEHDIGPSAKITFGPLQRGDKEISPYIRMWYARSLGPDKKGVDLFYTALGVSF